MKKIVALFFALIAYPLSAATPITCAQLTAAGYNLIHFGFTGVGPTGGGSSPNLFAMAGSNDGGTTWTSIGGTWPTCGNGTPCKVNSPAALEYTDSTTNVCHVYLLIAEANDGNNATSTFQDIGVLNTDYSVTTLLTFDWSSIGSVGTIFAGRWIDAPAYTNCFVTPVSSQTGPTPYDFTIYSACASLTPTSASIVSGPTAVTTTGTPSGYSPGYDSAIHATGSNCTLVETMSTSGVPYRTTALFTGACPYGPYAFQVNATTWGSPLLAQNNLSTQNEGPNYVHTVTSGSWYFFFEAITSHQNYYSNCVPLDLIQCKVATPQPWVEDQQYRAGTIIRTATAPLPSTTLYGGTYEGGTFQ